MTGGLLFPATMLAACSSTTSPQGIAQSYLTDWARRDWAGMRALVASSAGWLRRRECDRAH